VAPRTHRASHPRRRVSPAITAGTATSTWCALPWSGWGFSVASCPRSSNTSKPTRPRIRLTLPHPDPGFLIVQMLDILAFAGLVVPAFIWRKDPSVHKRLILLATFYISDAGFARWQGGAMEALFGNGFRASAAQLYFGSELLVLGVGLYDWITRKRLHPAYIAGIAWITAVELTALSVYMSPDWAPVAQRLLGR
jgi:hypothetical protein